MSAKPGTLYIVATPLGNLEDLTFRAERILREVAMVAAEDTRRTRKLLSHYGMTTRMVSYREQNHAKMLPTLLEALQNGEDVALVSDAGTPAISDPGVLLVDEAVRAGATVTPIPGPSAVACLLSVAGLAADHYVFAGFLPPKAKARRDALDGLKSETKTLVFFEGPHRLIETLTDMRDVLGDRKAVLGREMTKLNEEFIRGTLSEVRETVAGRPESIRGEITLAVAGAAPQDELRLDRHELMELIRNDLRPVRDIVADLSRVAPLSRSDLYRLVLEVKQRD